MHYKEMLLFSDAATQNGGREFDAGPLRVFSGSVCSGPTWAVSVFLGKPPF